MGLLSRMVWGLIGASYQGDALIVGESNTLNKFVTRTLICFTCAVAMCLKNSFPLLKIKTQPRSYNVAIEIQFFFSPGTNVTYFRGRGEDFSNSKVKIPIPIEMYLSSFPISICIWGSFSSKLLKNYLHPVIWNEAPKSRYHITLPIIVLVMHAIRVKYNSNYEVSASPDAPPKGFLVDFLCTHFVA